MTYSVVVTQRAKDDLRHYYAVAAKHAPETATRWLDRFEDALQTLSANPTRCPLAPENDLVVQPIYQLFFGKRAGRYRALFTIDGNQVLVLHIRRGAMDKAAEADLFG
ncbi:MAG: type II toxin-antitoxin system RelE/ParE family toxin [Planctomycetaceae bacterium]|jgi:plasmid stabilization system protein ParE|nr:type II toxin-antitoxin system RelE/ParE family toxin [Planctomycetaceae bacterium]